jgi:hypothetical protein
MMAKVKERIVRWGENDGIDWRSPSEIKAFLKKVSEYSDILGDAVSTIIELQQKGECKEVMMEFTESDIDALEEINKYLD